MIDLNSLSKENLMNRISKAYNGMLEIQRLKEQKSEEEKSLIFSQKWAEPSNEKPKVRLTYIIFMLFLWHFVWMYLFPVAFVTILILIDYFYPDILSAYIGTDIKTYLESQEVDVYINYLLVNILITTLFTIKSVRKKRKELIKKCEETKEFEDKIRKSIPKLQQEILVLTSSLEAAQKKNAPYINAFPADYQSITKLNGIYNILYNQRAANWADAVNIYLQDKIQEEKVQEEIRHNQQMEQVQQQYVKAQERQWEEQRRQNEERLRQNRWIADEIEGQIADINMKMR